MKIKEIKKRSGGKRVIYAVGGKEREKYRDILKGELSYFPIPEYAHGFVPGRNIITNAEKHVGKKVSISMDLSDFFPSCLKKNAKGIFSKEVIKVCFPDGAAQQGLPTSPAIANIMAEKMDTDIAAMLETIGEGFVYSRYADDLTISTNIEDYDVLYNIVRKVEEIALENNFKVNKAKTHIQNSKGGRREVCGVMVEDKVYASKYHNHKLRGLKHKLKFLAPDSKEYMEIERKAQGLSEFTNLKKPFNLYGDIVDKYIAIKLPEIFAAEAKDKIPVALDRNFMTWFFSVSLPWEIGENGTVTRVVPMKNIIEVSRKFRENMTNVPLKTYPVKDITMANWQAINGGINEWIGVGLVDRSYAAKIKKLAKHGVVKMNGYTGVVFKYNQKGGRFFGAYCNIRKNSYAVTGHYTKGARHGVFTKKYPNETVSVGEYSYGKLISGDGVVW